MQLARLAVVIDAIPIINAICGVAVLLNLDQHVTGADRVKSTSRQKNGIAGLDWNSVNEVGNRSCAHGLLELIATDRMAKSHMKSSAGDRRGDMPEFRLWFAAKFRGDFLGRMNLKRKLVVRIEQFNEQRETRRVWQVSKDTFAIVRPKFVQCSITERSVAHHTLCFGPIDNFP